MKRLLMRLISVLLAAGVAAPPAAVAKRMVSLGVSTGRTASHLKVPAHLALRAGLGVLNGPSLEGVGGLIIPTAVIPESLNVKSSSPKRVAAPIAGRRIGAETGKAFIPKTRQGIRRMSVKGAQRSLREIDGAVGDRRNASLSVSEREMTAHFDGAARNRIRMRTGPVRGKSAVRASHLLSPASPQRSVVNARSSLVLIGVLAIAVVEPAFAQTFGEAASPNSFFMDGGSALSGLSFASLGVALGAGFLAFVSPCCLPLLPFYLSYISGISVGEIKSGENRSSVRKKVLIGALGFVAGFSAIFMVLGATATAFGAFLETHFYDLTLGAGALIAAFGLHKLGLFKLDFLNRQASFDSSKHGGGFWGSLAMGVLFGLAWTPCVGPILGAILSLAAVGETIYEGMALLGAFSAGLGVPFLITALGVDKTLGFFDKFKKHLPVIDKATGALLVLMGGLLITGQLEVIAIWAQELFPGL